jgi:prepilin-type N-terminal cleavage/methylation domain-containing protein
MMVRIGTKKQGFTLIETVVASAILCGAVLTVGAISTRSLTGTKINRRYETALTLIDKQLSLIDYVGIDEFLDLGQTEGDFEGYEPVYHWKVSTMYQEIDSLYLVTITVSWIEQNRPYSITVDTMLDGVSLYSDTGTSTGI